MRVWISGNHSGRYYYDTEYMVCPINFPPFSREACDYNGFRLQIKSALHDSMTLNVSYNELVILRNILNTVIK